MYKRQHNRLTTTTTTITTTLYSSSSSSGNYTVKHFRISHIKIIVRLIHLTIVTRPICLMIIFFFHRVCELYARHTHLVFISLSSHSSVFALCVVLLHCNLHSSIRNKFVALSALRVGVFPWLHFQCPLGSEAVFSGSD